MSASAFATALPAPRPAAPPVGTVTVSVLEGARSVLARGWVRGVWYVLELPDGRHRPVPAGSLVPRGRGVVVAACLVGAVAEAAHRYSPERGLAGPAIDALWQALPAAERRSLHEGGRGLSPSARGLQARDLARWNDHPVRTKGEVLALVDTALARLPAAAR